LAGSLADVTGFGRPAGSCEGGDEHSSPDACPHREVARHHEKPWRGTTDLICGKFRAAASEEIADDHCRERSQQQARNETGQRASEIDSARTSDKQNDEKKIRQRCHEEAVTGFSVPSGF